MRDTLCPWSTAPDPALGKQVLGELMQREILVGGHQAENKVPLTRRLKRPFRPPLLIPLDRRGWRHRKTGTTLNRHQSRRQARIAKDRAVVMFIKRI